MEAKLTLDLDAIRVTTFEAESAPTLNPQGAATINTLPACCGTGCNTRNTCSTSLC